MRIPEIQAELLTIAHYLGSERIAVLARALSRRKGEKGKKVSATMTPELRATIRRAHNAEPDTPQIELARRFNVSSGRVSEILSGKRT